MATSGLKWAFDDYGTDTHIVRNIAFSLVWSVGPQTGVSLAARWCCRDATSPSPWFWLWTLVKPAHPLVTARRNGQQTDAASELQLWSARKLVFFTFCVRLCKMKDGYATIALCMNPFIVEKSVKIFPGLSLQLYNRYLVNDVAWVVLYIPLHLLMNFL